MFGHSRDFQIIVNVVKNLTFNMLFLAKKIGFVSLRHNLVRNITSSLLSEVCKDVRVEQQLQLTAKKVSKYGVFSGPNAGKYGPEKTPYLDTFHAVW